MCVLFSRLVFYTLFMNFVFSMIEREVYTNLIDCWMKMLEMIRCSCAKLRLELSTMRDEMTLDLSCFCWFFSFSFSLSHSLSLTKHKTTHFVLTKYCCFCFSRFVICECVFWGWLLKTSICVLLFLFAFSIDWSNSTFRWNFSLAVWHFRWTVFVVVVDDVWCTIGVPEKKKYFTTFIQLALMHTNNSLYEYSVAAIRLESAIQ